MRCRNCLLSNTYYYKFIALLIFVCCHSLSYAQQWSIPNTSLDKQMEAIVFIESMYPAADGKSHIDTLSGTGFLITDQKKIYLVTAKHLVTAKLLGNDQQSPNTFSVSADWQHPDNSVKIPVPDKKAFIFSPDELDIAIIALTPKVYTGILKGLPKQDCKPLPLTSIDIGDDHYPDENFYRPMYMVFKDKAGEKKRSKGLGQGKIQTFDDKAAVYNIDMYTGNATVGSPLFVKDKIIGMTLRPTGITSNADVVEDQYKSSKTAVVVKASYIIPLLRELQANQPDIQKTLLKQSQK